jgi:uncharacterized protein YfaQ (DUF2300 family)
MKRRRAICEIITEEKRVLLSYPAQLESEHCIIVGTFLRYPLKYIPMLNNLAIVV